MTETPVPEVEITPARVQTRRERLWEYVLACLKIGATSFGAPTAHIAMMEYEFVQKHKWITEDELLEMLAAANIVPGPNASELCYHVGYRRAGYPGLILGGLAFITPSYLSAVIMGILYLKFGSLPQVEDLFYVLNPLVLAIILDTTWRISKSSFQNWKQFVILGLAILAKILGLNEVLILLGTGALGIALHHDFKNQKGNGAPGLMALMPFAPLLGWAARQWAIWENKTVQIFLYFLKTGAVMFGSAMVLFALIEKDITQRFGWMSLQQLTDSIAVGQITPGPVTSSSAFIGFLVGGFPGSLAAMIGVFLPSFIIVMITAPLLDKMRESVLAKSFLKGVNAGVVALILAVVVVLGQNALFDVWTVLLLALGLFALMKLKLQPYALVLFGLALGLLRVFVLK